MGTHVENWKKIKKKYYCWRCKEVKSFNDFPKNRSTKHGVHNTCKKCHREIGFKYRNTEKGYLKMKYQGCRKHEKTRKWKCSFTFDELYDAFQQHKRKYGMKSAWGPGIDHLEEHLPITIIQKGEGIPGTRGGRMKGTKSIPSNLSIDRLDSTQDYTVQNVIFIRGDENLRKKDTTYRDCFIQIRLHEERFGK